MERLSAADAAFLYLEEAARPQQSGTLAIFDGGAAFDATLLRDVVARTVAGSRRYRQRVLTVPGRLAPPVWVDDEGFDLAYHLRRTTLPAPGGDDELNTLVARVMGRPLDRAHPLWELYIVEGLTDGKFALLVKTHHALVDGVETLDLAQLLLSESPEVAMDADAGTPAAGESAGGAATDSWRTDEWAAEEAPTRAELVASALAEAVRRPGELADTLRTTFPDVRTTARAVVGAVGTMASAVRRAAWPADRGLPLDTVVSERRAYATVRHDLADYKAIHARLGGSLTDVMLASVTGALRGWLQTRGETVASRATVRAIVPVSVRNADAAGRRLGMNVSSYPVELPVGEPSPIMRVHQIGFATQAHKDSGEAIGADALVALAGFAPPTLHALAARVAGTVARRASSLVVTNAPGPQSPRYTAGHRLVATYPVTAVGAGQAVSVGITSYDGGVFYGLNADRETMPDVAVFAGCLAEGLEELRAAANE